MQTSRYGYKLLSILGALALVISHNACVRGFLADDMELASMTTSANLLTNVEKGRALYAENCQGCHQELSRTTIGKGDVATIDLKLATVSAMQGLRSLLSSSDVQKISMALQNPNMGSPTCTPAMAGFVNIRRLNRFEYNNVIRDLTSLDTKPANAFPNDQPGLFFTTIATSLGVDLTLGDHYFKTAISVLDNAFSKARAVIVTCDPNAAAGHRACADRVIREFGMKAFRRPLVTAEVNQFLALYDTNRASYPGGANFDEGLKSALQGILISPQFLFQIIDREGFAPTVVKTLNGYELASRLSFFIWGSIPDAQLFNLAANGSLLDRNVLNSEINRMLKDPKSTHLIDSFAMQWLKLERFALRQVNPDPATFPEFNETLRDSMLTETRMLLSDIIQKDGNPRLLVTGNYTYLNQQLASHYGLSGPTTAQFQRVSLDNTERVGILTHGSVLTSNSKTAESSIVLRGVWTLDRLLCAPPGMPPDNAVPANPVDTSKMNPRQKLAAHTNDSRCVSCHSRIDPIGISLEKFDGDGKLRAKYWTGDLIDTFGQFPPPSNAQFNGPKEMSQALVQSGSYNICIARHLMNFGLGRELTSNDKCAADIIGNATVTSTSKFSDLVKGIVNSEQFLKQTGSN